MTLLLEHEAIAADLRRTIRGRVQRDVDLRTLSRWRIGGRARLVVEPGDADDACDALARLHDMGLQPLVIGDGSNLLFDDAGLLVPVVRIGAAMSGFRVEGREVWAEAGLWVPDFARRVGRAGLSGAEHTVGIPGTLGGLVVMNGGSLRHGVGEQLVSVRVADRAGRDRVLSHEECRFAYRRSALQGSGLTVLEARFAYAPDDPGAIRRRMLKIIGDRRRKFPKNLPNCGSVFLSDPAMYDVVGPPGRAIENVGLKGVRRGGAQISPLHANFIVNLGDARSSDVLELIALARRTVHERTGFWMDCEVRHVAPDGTVRPAHEPAGAQTLAALPL